jgi:hypothetical protein
MGFFNRLFGRKEAAPTDKGIYFYVRCSNCKRDLQQTDDGTYEIHKEMTDDRCFRRIQFDATFDGSRKLVRTEVHGGKLIDRATWEAEKDLPRRPPEPEGESAENL